MYFQKLVLTLFILLIGTMTLLAWKYVLQNGIPIPLINPRVVSDSSSYNGENDQIIGYKKYFVNKSIYWDQQMSSQLRPIGYLQGDDGLGLTLAPQRVEFQVLNDTVLIQEKQTNITFNISTLENPNTIEKISKIMTLNRQNQEKRLFYQIQQPLSHSIYFRDKHCLFIGTVQGQSKNNKENRYLSFRMEERNLLTIVHLSINRLLIVQVYDCQNESKKLLAQIKHSVMKASQSQVLKIQSFEVFRSNQQQHNNIFSVKMLSFSKDIALVSFEVIKRGQDFNISLTKERVFKSHEISQLTKAVGYNITLQSSYKQLMRRFAMDIFSYMLLETKQLLIGNVSESILRNVKLQRELNDYSRQKQIPLVVLYPKQNALLYVSPNNNSQMWKLGNHMKPTSTPVFSNNPISEDILQGILNSSLKETQVNNFKYFQILSNNDNQTGEIPVEEQMIVSSAGYYSVEHVYPSTQVHWLGLNRGTMYFYPGQNIKDDEYYLIRTSKGGVVIKGQQLQGKHQDLPYKDQQISQRVFTIGQEFRPMIFEIHIAYKHLISYPVSKKRIELIHGLNGKPLLTYFTRSKQGFQVGCIKLQNNQWFIGQYHANREYTLLTKYQLFTNLSNIHQILYIKRQYSYPGYIKSVFKCIDGFYYMENIDKNGELGIIRVGVNFMNNRMTKVDKKYSGYFQEYMLDDDLNKKYLKQGGFTIQEQPIVLKTQIRLNELMKQPQKLNKFYPYEVLPYSIFVDNADNSDFVYYFNLRQMVIVGLDKYMKDIQRDAIVMIIVILIAIEVVLIAFCLKPVSILYKSKPQQISSASDKKDKRDKTKQNQHKDQSSNNQPTSESREDKDHKD